MTMNAPRNLPKTFFTGQKITDETVICPVCGERVGLTHGFVNGATGLAYLDPYRGKNGKYVHFRCLSEKRLKEINTPANPFTVS
jgi:hypothetical protein